MRLAALSFRSNKLKNKQLLRSLHKIAQSHNLTITQTKALLKSHKGFKTIALLEQNPKFQDFLNDPEIQILYNHPMISALRNHPNVQFWRGMKQSVSKRTYTCYVCDQIIDTESAKYRQTKHAEYAIEEHRKLHFPD